MDKDNNFVRLLAVLALALFMCLGMYWLPDQCFSYPIKKVDLLSDLRLKPEAAALDSLRLQLAMEDDTLQVDTAALRDSVVRTTGVDSVALALRDSLYQVLVSVKGADSLGKHIEDYSIGHIGLKRFFEALDRRDTLGRPVRVAFLGDSFIEGDILVADFRSALQKAFGGRGVGFLPVTSVAAQYRPTIEQKAEGWKTWSMMTDHTQAYTLPGLTFEPEEGEAPTLSLKTTARYPELTETSTFQLLYERNEATALRWTANASADTLVAWLPPTDSLALWEARGAFRELHCRFAPQLGFRLLGVALEDDRGVVVDNYSLRGNSGMILNRLDSARCRQLAAVRPYDLIVLQYGLNVASDSVLHYGWYGKKMEVAIRHLRACFPEADVLLLGVSDRSRQADGHFETMPAVLSLLHTQRQTARRLGIPFWNLFGAMGGENSMVEYVGKNWASKDYTHLGFRGGRELADALFNALMAEKEFYDEAAQAGY